MPKTKSKAKSRQKPSKSRFNQLGLLRLNKKLAAFVVLFAIIGGGFYIATSNGSPRLATNEHVASASSTYSICSQRYGGCILSHGSGNTVSISDSNNNTYRRIQGLACSTGSCAQYQDVQTGLCLKYDPNIADHRVVEYYCDNSGDDTWQEEEWMFSGGILSSLYSLGGGSTTKAMADLDGQGRVTVQPSTALGTLWVLN